MDYTYTGRRCNRCRLPWAGLDIICNDCKRQDQLEEQNELARKQLAQMSVARLDFTRGSGDYTWSDLGNASPSDEEMREALDSYAKLTAEQKQSLHELMAERANQRIRQANNEKLFRLFFIALCFALGILFLYIVDFWPLKIILIMFKAVAILFGAFT